jgi:hypothetical protein
MKFLNDKGIQEGVALTDREVHIFNDILFHLSSESGFKSYLAPIERDNIAVMILSRYTLTERNPPVTEELLPSGNTDYPNDI